MVKAIQKLLDACARVAESDHRGSKPQYARDPCGLEFGVLWHVSLEDRAAE